MDQLNLKSLTIRIIPVATHHTTKPTPRIDKLKGCDRWFILYLLGNRIRLQVPVAPLKSQINMFFKAMTMVANTYLTLAVPDDTK